MKRIFDITTNDLRQLLRDRQTFLFLLLMPVVSPFYLVLLLEVLINPKPISITVFSVILINLDEGKLRGNLANQLSQSMIFQIVENQIRDEANLAAQIKDERSSRYRNNPPRIQHFSYEWSTPSIGNPYHTKYQRRLYG